MSALTVSQEPDRSWDDLVRFWEETERSEGSKVEIIEGIITVSPAPAYRHNVIAARIQRRLYSVIPEDWEVLQTSAIAVPSRLGMLVPDLVAAPVREHTESDTHVPAACAAAGIPLCLLVDRRAPEGPTAALHGEPKGDVHRPLSTAKFGEPVRLPAPFDLVIDTAEFPGS
ncbi:Uma2 family endonuclease [Streptomyces griseomycini]|uniref:Uma2 family endonuclease n=1 Tax=Streptomyces griseomycini TaxID=66895 RepID=UPI003429AE88